MRTRVSTLIWSLPRKLGQGSRLRPCHPATAFCALKLVRALYVEIVDSSEHFWIYFCLLKRYCYPSVIPGSSSSTLNNQNLKKKKQTQNYIPVEGAVKDTAQTQSKKPLLAKTLQKCCSGMSELLRIPLWWIMCLCKVHLTILLVIARKLLS